MNKLITFCFLILAPLAQAQQFQSPITDTHWQVVESPLECTLSQDIPGFGSAKFSQKSGTPFSLIFHSKTQPSVQTNIAFEIAEAHWQNIEDRLHLISIPALNNQTSFSVEGQIAKQAFTHIQEGRVPVIRYRSQHIDKEISVLMSIVHLTDSLNAFQQCVANIHPDTFEDIRRLTIGFAREKAELTLAAEEALDRIANYVKIDDQVKRIMVSGHTDNHGYRRINQPLSYARAIAVKNYLVSQGVLENLITVSSQIEFSPVATNRTVEGRRLNRRAEIEVIRR